MALDKVQFFGVADRKGKRKDGDIASPYPSWYFTRQFEELERSIAFKEHQLKSDLVAPAARPGIKRELEMERERLDAINKSRVKLSGKEKDEAKGLYDDLGKEIQESMFTYREMRKGFADPHEEVRRMKKPIIQIDKKHAGVMKNLGVRVSNDGKISRDDATRVYQIIGKTLGENTNVERLRKDPVLSTYRGEVPLHELMQD